MKDLHSGNMKKIVWCFFILTLPLSVCAQEDFPKEAQRKLTQYYTDNQPVQLALFFNQPEYAAGDTVWFKAAFVAAGDHRPVAKRQIINVTLLSESGTNVLHQKILLTDGYGFNQITIPTSFTPGVYTLVAYSDWMKNFDQSLFAYHDLIITGEKILKRRVANEIMAYPEGGSLVGGVNNRVAIKGVPGSNVTLSNSQNQTVSCRLNDDGFGSLVLSPATNDSYRLSDCTRTSELKTSNEKNIAMMVTSQDNSPGSLHIRLTANGETNRSEEYYLLVTHGGNVYGSNRITFAEAQVDVRLDAGQLRSGLMLITLFRNNRSVEAERMFFIDANYGVQATVQTDQNAYTPRGKVDLQLNIRDRSGSPMASVVGVTVFQNELFPQTNTGAARSLLVPGSYSMMATDVNDFLITQQWKQFVWSDVLNGGKKNQHKFKSNLHFTGRVVDGDKLTVGGLPVVSFFLSREVRIYAEYLKKDGTFDFPMFFDFEGQERVFYTIEKVGSIIPGTRMIIESDTIEITVPRNQYTATALPDPFLQFANSRKALDAAYRVGTVDEMKSQQVNPHAFIEDEVFDADVSVDLSEYLIFPTMEETLREIIPSLQHRWKNGKHIVRAKITEPDIVPKGDPIYFIDGVLTGDTDYFMSLKPENISRIKIIRSQRKLSAFGAIGKYGIVLVETKLLNNAQNVPQSLNSFVATGLTQPISFKPTNVTNPKLARTPIFKSTLYWNPSVLVGADGKANLSFYTADNTGTFTIRVDGFAANGEPITVEKMIEVKFKRPIN
jgi:hypothetical protein